MSEINRPHSSAANSSETKRFRASIKVEQVGDDLNIVGVTVAMMLCAVPGFWLSFASMYMAEQGLGKITFLNTLGFYGGIVLAMIGAILGIVLWFMFEDYRDKIKGIPALFSKKTWVTIDENGLKIEGLGLSKWNDVLSLEGLPDAEHMLIVYTTQFGKLMLHHDINTLSPIINGYLYGQHESNLQAAQGSKHNVFSFNAVIFRWPIFFTWIIAGYLLATFVAFILIFASEKSFFATTLALIVLVPICAYLIWTIAFWQLSLFEGKRTKAFDLIQDRLISKDKMIDIDLHNTKVTYHHKSGIGYKLYFMCVKPQTGRQIDLLVGQDEWFVLQKKFNN